METFIGSIVAGTLVLTNEITNVWIQVEQPNLEDYIYDPGNITITDCGHQLWTYIGPILDYLSNSVLPYLIGAVSAGGLAQIYS